VLAVSVPWVRVMDLLQGGYEGREVEVRGWVHRKRIVGGKAFIVVRQEGEIIQAVFNKSEVSREVWSRVEEVTVESSVKVRGVVRSDPRAPGGYEIRGSDLTVVGLSDVFPIKGNEGVEYLLDQRHLWLRSRRLTWIMRLKHKLLEAAREYLSRNGWWEVTPPILTGSAVEGGATLFELKYFDAKAYLSQSAQLYLEVLIYSLDKVWSLTPSFRAEKSRTRRHLAEYWHLELEAAWMDMWDMMRVTEELTKHIVSRILERGGEELSKLGRNTRMLERSIEEKYPTITYDEAISILQGKGVNISWGEDLGADEERALTEEFETPFFVTHFPKHIKAFYMKLDEKRPDVVLGFDLLAPEGYGEIVGGSQREDDYNKLLSRIVEEGLDPSDYTWYLDLRRYGSVPHSGFGLGTERMLMWIAGLDHIRDTMPMPRYRGRIKP